MGVGRERFENSLPCHPLTCMAGYVTKNHCLKIYLFLFSVSNLFKLKLFAEIIQLFLYV